MRSEPIGDQIREEAEEADGRVVGDDLERLHDAVRDVLEQLRGLGLRAAGRLHAEAEQHRRHDQRQDGLAAPKLCEIGLGEEVDDHIGHAQRAADLALDQIIFARDRRDEPHNDVGDDCGDGRRHEERRNGHAHDLTGALGALHIRDRGRDRAEHRRDGDAEHQVQEHGAERLEHGRALDDDHRLTVNDLLDRRPDGADDAAGDDTDQHQDQEAVVFQKAALFHNTPSK
jgi:hypothetical protein